MKTLITITILLLILFLTACDQRYRYYCQDPDHWGEKPCKPPACVVTETCPDVLIKPDPNEKYK